LLVFVIQVNLLLFIYVVVSVYVVERDVFSEPGIQHPHFGVSGK
jgi:hypothetical protein